MKRFGGMFRIGVSTIAAAALLAGAAASPAAAAAADSGLEKLWEEFPLDNERQAPAPRTPATDEGPATARAPAPAERPSAARPANPGTNSWASERIGLLVAILALLVAAAAVGVARFRGASRREGSTTRPTLRWLPQQPAPSPAVSPVGGDVVGGLLRAASAGVPRQRAAKLGQNPKRSTRAARAEMADGKRLVEALKQPAAEAGAEADVLKRKGLADSTLAVKAKSERGLKAKSEGGDSRMKEQLAWTADIVLKEKLAPKRERKRSAGPVENGRPGRGAKSRAKRESALRPVPASGAETHGRARAEAGDTRMRECEVEWWRGYVKSVFFAIETSPGGFGRTIASSPFFRWRRRDVPRETPEAAAALRSLVESLEREGWTVAGRRKEWFGVKLRMASDVAAPGTTGSHQPQTGRGGRHWQSGQTMLG